MAVKAQQAPRLVARHRIGHRVPAVLMVLALTVIYAVIGVVIHRAQEGRRETIAQRFATRHTTASLFIEAYQQQTVSQQLKLARDYLSDPVVSAADFTQLAQLNQLNSAVLYDGDGRRLQAYPAGAGAEPSGPPDSALQSALNGTPAVTAVTTPGDVAGPPLIAFAVNYQTATGPRVFTGRYPVSETMLQPIVANALPAYTTAHTYLVDARGTVIVADRRDNSGLLLTQVAPALAEVIQNPSGFLPAFDEYYVSGPVGSTGWRLVFSLKTSELYQTLTWNQKYTPWVALTTFFLMGLGIVAMFTRALADRTQAIDDHARQEAILDSAGDGFIGTDGAGLVTDWNTAATEILGWTRAEALGRPVVSLIFEPADQPGYAAELQTYLKTGGTTLADGATALTVRHRDGRSIPVEITVARNLWQGNWRLHGFLRDITERLEQERRLQELALTDSLTGLANRRAFLDQLEQALTRTQRQGSRLAVLYGDVDHFKAINDTYGHAAGDAVLEQVAHRLKAHFRAEDTVGRLGGDEFAVICEHHTLDSEHIVNRLRAVLSVPYSFRDQLIMATVSVGLASPEDGETTSHLLERADSTMYRAKAAR